MQQYGVDSSWLLLSLRILETTLSFVSSPSMQPSPSSHLDLETSAPSPSTSLLEFPSLRLDIRLLVLVWAHTEMLNGFSRVLGSSEQDDVRAGWVLHGQLVDGHAAATGLLDASARRGGEAEGCDV